MTYRYLGGLGEDAKTGGLAPLVPTAGMTGEQFAWHLTALLRMLPYLERQFDVLEQQCKDGTHPSGDATEVWALDTVIGGLLGTLALGPFGLVAGVILGYEYGEADADSLRDLCTSGQIAQYDKLRTEFHDLIQLTDALLPGWRTWADKRDAVAIAHRIGGVWIVKGADFMGVKLATDASVAMAKASWPKSMNNWYKAVAAFVTFGRAVVQQDLNYRYERALQEEHLWANLSVIYSSPGAVFENMLNVMAGWVESILRGLGQLGGAAAEGAASLVWKIVKPLLLTAAVASIGLAVYSFRHEIADAVRIKAFKHGNKGSRMEVER